MDIQEEGGGEEEQEEEEEEEEEEVEEGKEHNISIMICISFCFRYFLSVFTWSLLQTEEK